MKPEIELFPHRTDVTHGRVTFVRSQRAILEEMAFLDGREEFWSGPPVTIELDQLNPDPPDTLHPLPVILHVGFCGSTWLTRRLTNTGTALVLREPRALTDIAAFQAALDRTGTYDPGVATALRATCLLLGRRWKPEEAVALKPSNWVNNIAPLLAEALPRLQPLFLTMNRRAFLQAVWRGGQARIAFAARAAVHFSDGREDWSRHVADALHAKCDEMTKLALLAALMHRFQEELFAISCRKGCWSRDRWMSFEELQIDPEAATERAASLLGLPDSGNPAGRWIDRHAKQPDLSFDRDKENDANQGIDARFGVNFDRAFALLDDMLPSASRIAVHLPLSKSHPETEMRSAPA